MKKRLMLFMCLVAMVMVICGNVRAENDENIFFYEDIYKGITTSALILRDWDNNEITTIPEGEEVLVKGVFPYNPARVIVEWEEKEGTVLSQYIEKVALYAITRTELEQLDSLGNYIQSIPAWEMVILKEESIGTRVKVEWNGIEGNVLADYLDKDFIIINLQEQRLLMYEDSKKICDSPTVTGTDGTSRQTPTGVFSIQSMNRSTILKGEGYESYVEYWMPFNYGYGIHDADGWRSSYGGDIYKTNGSHGCVNIPLSKAQEIYENAYVGMLVIVK